MRIRRERREGSLRIEHDERTSEVVARHDGDFWYVSIDEVEPSAEPLRV
tara:strand:- start:1722 stop:1868 length:147 start_codon:yes stop_codon:yes gene_type:complete